MERLSDVLRILLMFAVATGFLTPAAGAMTLDPGDSRIVYTGRFDYSDPAGPVCSFPGTQITVRFSGPSAAVRMRRVQGQDSYYYVLLDGGEPRKVAFGSGAVTQYPLCSGLADVPHELTLFRLNEATLNADQFCGFVFDDGTEVLAAAPQPPLWLEMIGDSWTAGWGNEDSSRITVERPAYTNNYLAYGALIARHFSLRYSCVAQSGLGMAASTPTIPELYAQAVTNTVPAAWDFTKYHPDLVILFAGINDYWEGPPDAAQYRAVYAGLLNTIKTNHPGAVVVCLTGLGNAADEADLAGHVSASISSCAGAWGASSFRQMKMPAQLQPTGSLFHPSVASHRLFAETFIPQLKPVVDSLAALRITAAAPRAPAAAFATPLNTGRRTLRGRLEAPVDGVDLRGRISR